MPPLAGRIAGAGLAVAAVAIAVLATLIHGDMARETDLSREIQALQEVKDGLDALKDSLHRMRHAVVTQPRQAGLAREQVTLSAELDYLRAKAAERPDVAPAIAALEGPVRDYADQAEIAIRATAPGQAALDLVAAEDAAFRAVRRAENHAADLVNAKTNAQIGLWASREVYVRALVAGTIAVLVLLAVAFRNLYRRARRDAARIEQLAHFDSLTGLANRSLLDDRLARLVALSERNAAPLAVLLFDLDGFKAVNDLHGHAAGDSLLVAVAQRAASCVRASDTVGRLGGDEFLVLLPDTDREGARSVAHKLLEAMTRPFDVGPARVSVSASIGGAFLPGQPVAGGALVRAADAALYESKRRGRNAYTEAADAPGEPGPGGGS
ncbi:MAG: GGDEF domain-containing protein [Burkholderiales bacterium]|nr:GGDEF domain-containing protein [Burkholderiales bacterium]